jgi:hypothetical protein
VHAESARYAAAVAAGDFDTTVVYTGEAIDMIHSIEPAEAILHRLVAEAEAALAGALIESTATGSAEPNASCVPWYRK